MILLFWYTVHIFSLSILSSSILYSLSSFYIQGSSLGAASRIWQGSALTDLHSTPGGNKGLGKEWKMSDYFSGWAWKGKW